MTFTPNAIIRTVCAYIAPVRRNDIKFLHFTFVDSVAQSLNMNTNDRISVNSFHYRLQLCDSSQNGTISLFEKLSLKSFLFYIKFHKIFFSY